MTEITKTVADQPNSKKRKVETAPKKRAFLGLAQTKEEFIDMLPTLKDSYDTNRNTAKFICGLESCSATSRFLFVGYDKDIKMAYGHVRRFEDEWGVIDLDELQQEYVQSKGLFQLVPFKEIFRDGPKTMGQLKSRGLNFH